MQFSRSLQELPSPRLPTGYGAPYQDPYEAYPPLDPPPSGGPRRTWSSDAISSSARLGVGGGMTAGLIELPSVYGMPAPPPQPSLPPDNYPSNPESQPDNESNEPSDTKRGKRRTRNADETADTSHEDKKTKGARKTAVACNFCRGKSGV
ncbi:hypothetical protein AX16_007993 [Volvariella volvacea WC 439]|nr:hypothetical protein AX16_007993 [Volvariella volvacea WC 439]